MPGLRHIRAGGGQGPASFAFDPAEPAQRTEGPLFSAKSAFCASNGLQGPYWWEFHRLKSINGCISASQSGGQRKVGFYCEITALQSVRQLPTPEGGMMEVCWRNNGPFTQTLHPTGALQIHKRLLRIHERHRKSVHQRGQPLRHILHAPLLGAFVTDHDHRLVHAQHGSVIDVST